MGNFQAMQKAKSFFGYAGAGIAYAVVAGIILGIIGNSLQIDVTGDWTIFGTAIAQQNIVGIVVGLITWGILGGLTIVFGIIGVKIRRMVGSKENEIHFAKRPAVLAIIAVGFVTAGIFTLLNQLLGSAFPDADVTDPMTLLSAVAEVNVGFIVASLVGLAIVGYLIIRIAKATPIISDNLPEKTRKF